MNPSLTPQQVSQYSSQLRPTPTPSSTPNTPTPGTSLTPDQVKNYATQLSTTKVNSTPSQSWDAFDKAVGNTPNPGVMDKVGGFFNDIGKTAAQDMGGAFTSAYEGAKEGFTSGTVPGAIHGTMRAAEGVMAPIGEAIDYTTGKTLSKGVEGAGNTLQKLAPDFWNKAVSVADKYPELSTFILKDLPTALNVATLGVGGGEVKANMEAPKIEPTPTAEPVVPPPAPKPAAPNPAVVAEKSAWEKPSTVPSGFNKAKEIYQTAQSKGHNISDTLVNSGVRISDHIETGPTGKKVFSTADTADKLHSDASKLSNEVLRPSLQKADAQVPLTPVKDLISDSVKNINKSKLPAEDKIDLVNSLTKTQKALESKYPNGMKLSEIHDEKIVRDLNSKYSPVGDVSTNMNATKNKAIGDAARVMVEQKAPKDIPVDAFNQVLEKSHQAANYLYELNGKTAPRDVMSNVARWGAKITGAAVGGALGGGIFGSLGGYHLGGIVESFIEDLPANLRTTALENLEKTNPEAFTQVKSYLDNPAKGGELRLPARGESSFKAGTVIAPAEGGAKGEYLGPNGPSHLDNFSDQTPKATAQLSKNSGGQAASNKSAPTDSNSVLMSKDSTLKNIKSQQGGYINIGQIVSDLGKAGGKLTDEMRSFVSKTLGSYDSTPVTVNGKINMGNSDKEFRIGQLQSILEKRALNDKEVKEAATLLKGSDSASKGNVSGDSISASIQKAKASGQSFEEWVKGQGKPLYHGSPYINRINTEGFKLGRGENLANAWGRGVYLAENKRLASGYSGLESKGGGIVETYIPKDLKLYKARAKDAYMLKNEELIKKGYGGVISETGGGNTTITVFDPTQVKTRSQLKAEWNKTK